VVLRAKYIVENAIKAETAHTVVGIERHRLRVADDDGSAALYLEQRLCDRRKKFQLFSTLLTVNVDGGSEEAVYQNDAAPLSIASQNMGSLETLSALALGLRPPVL
jgi:hypothetical protein